MDHGWVVDGWMDHGWVMDGLMDDGQMIEERKEGWNEGMEEGRKERRKDGRDKGKTVRNLKSPHPLHIFLYFAIKYTNKTDTGF